MLALVSVASCAVAGALPAAAAAHEGTPCRAHRARGVAYPGTRSLAACPGQGRFTCCSSLDDKHIVGSFASCVSDGSVSEKCCHALRSLQCVKCDGYWGTGASTGVCPHMCASAYRECADSFFLAADRGGVGAAGSLAPCSDDAVLCARLSLMLDEGAGPSAPSGEVADGGGAEEGGPEEAELTRRGHVFCTSLGLAPGQEGGVCYDGSAAIPPPGWKPPVVSASEQEEGEGGSRPARDHDSISSWTLERWVAEIRARVKRADPSVTLPAALTAAAALAAYGWLWTSRQRRDRQDLESVLGGAYYAAPFSSSDELTPEELRAKRLLALDKSYTAPLSGGDSGSSSEGVETATAATEGAGM